MPTMTEAEWYASAEDRRQPSWAEVRRALIAVGASAGEWAGCPLPVDGFPLVLEPRYPFPGLHGARLDEESPEAEIPAGARVVNSWYSHERGQMVYLCEDESGRFAVRLPQHGMARFGYWLHSLGVAQQAFDAATEIKALAKLQGLIRSHAFVGYLTAGCFLETSPRSGVTYLFRRMRPTVALRATASGTRILACLCLHPLGFYDGTHCGVMVPTDEAIAHLLLMRGDEAKFWGKANHHPIWAVGAGL